MSVDALAESCLADEERKGLLVGCHIRCCAVRADAVVCESLLWKKRVSLEIDRMTNGLVLLTWSQVFVEAEPPQISGQELS